MRVSPAIAAAVSALCVLAACSPPGQRKEALPAASPSTAAAVTSTAPGGAYTSDPAHTSLNFRVSHLGLSHYTARFTRLSGKLTFDPTRPEASTIEVTIDPTSLQTNYPDPAKLDFDAQIEREFLDAAHYPQMSFRSTKVEVTGPSTANVTGDLTLHGVTRPVTLQATFNGGYAPNGMDPMGSRIGFSAHGALKRSQFGITYGLPAPGSTMGVGDDVEVLIESEFTQPKAG